MIKKKLTIWQDNSFNYTGELWMNPDLRKQCIVAVRQEDCYEFMECHFEVWHRGGNALTNVIHCVNTLGIFFPISQIYCDYEGEYNIEKLEVCLFDPNDSKDKEILSEISYEQHLEYMKYDNI